MPNEMKEMRVAILIDAENVAPKYISIILNEANNLGNIIIKRIYGDWTSPQMASWRNTILDNSVQPIQQYSNVSGKNSSDSALIIDAMDLLYSHRLDCFCIVSSDSDFTRLAARLRESEMYVLGMGEQKTPQSFISACNKFSYIDILWAAAQPDTRESKQPSKEETKTGVRLKTIRAALVSICEENSDDNGWISSSLLGNLLGKQFPDFDVRNFRYKKFVPFVESLGLFETRRESLNVFFRLKSEK